MKKLTTKPHLFLTIAIALVAGCGKNDSQVPTSDSLEPLTAETTERELIVNAMPFEGIEIKLGGEAGQPLEIQVGQKLSGEFSSPQSGSYEHLGVHIGTHENTSDGDVRLELCSTEICSGGTVSVKGAPDNQFLGVKLAPELEVPAGGALRYTIERVSGDKPLAIWMYPKGEAFATSIGADGTTLETAPKLKVGIRP